MQTNSNRVKHQPTTRKQKRALKYRGTITDNGMLEENTSRKFGLKEQLKPITDNQELAFQYWDEGYHLMLHGVAGTGKTHIALGFVFEELLKADSQYEKVYIVRSTVASRDQGFMPGDAKAKAKVYEDPYAISCAKLFGRKDAYDVLKSRGNVEFVSTAFLRGVNLENCLIVVDEMQNMSFGELDTIITRVCENSRIIFAGDTKQDDLTSERKKETSGLRDFMRIINNMYEFEFVEFGVEDIVRSGLVKSYIIERHKLGM